MIFEEYSNSKTYRLGSVVSIGADLYISVSLGQISGHTPSSKSTVLEDRGMRAITYS